MLSYLINLHHCWCSPKTSQDSMSIHSIHFHLDVRKIIDIFSYIGLMGQIWIIIHQMNIIQHLRRPMDHIALAFFHSDHGENGKIKYPARKKSEFKKKMKIGKLENNDCKTNLKRVILSCGLTARYRKKTCLTF